MNHTFALTSVRSYISLMRVHQWVKNLFIFIPAFFGQVLFSNSLLYKHFLGFFAFSLVASAVYIINDYIDIEKDRLHPVKYKRPLASGAVSVPEAAVLFALCLAGGFSLALTINTPFLLLLCGYFVINIAYTFFLKTISLVDISIISLGFLIRVFAGGEIGDIVVSKWLILMTFLLSQLLALAKRRDDVLLKTSTGNEMRKSLQGYNLTFLNVAMVFFASVTVVAYIMYTVSPEVIYRMQNENIYLTSFFVIIGLMRYLQIALVEEKSGSPTEILLKDTFVQLTVVAWIICFGVLIYIF